VTKEDGMHLRAAPHWITASAALVVTLAMAGPAAASGPAGPSGNVGDSYAAGEGGTEYGPYLDGSDTATDKCHRSNTSAFELLARAHLIRPGANAACGGATTANITSIGQYGEPSQAAQLSARLKQIYVMIGGNDIAFGTLAGCFIQANCEQTPIPGASLQLIAQLGPKLDAAYSAIQAKAPRARVVVMLYPPLLPQDPSADRSQCPEINASEVSLGNQVQSALKQTITDRAHAHGFTVADPEPVFLGHDICAGPQTLFYRPGTPGTYHPNLAGRVALAAVDAAATLAATRAEDASVASNR
jgi:lysophospholipase L1-like esterase